MTLKKKKKLYYKNRFNILSRCFTELPNNIRSLEIGYYSVADPNLKFLPSLRTHYFLSLPRRLRKRLYVLISSCSSRYPDSPNSFIYYRAPGSIVDETYLFAQCLCISLICTVTTHWTVKGDFPKRQLISKIRLFVQGRA